MERVGNGCLPLKLKTFDATLRYRVFGGPFRQCPIGWFGVCLLERPVGDPQVHLPIRDFSVPEDKKQVKKAVKEALSALLKGYDVYVGCMGGWGRTGLMLSLLAKAIGYPDPIWYVREFYSQQAVETEEQEKFVADFPVAGIRWWLGWQLLKMKLSPASARRARHA